MIQFEGRRIPTWLVLMLGVGVVLFLVSMVLDFTLDPTKSHPQVSRWRIIIALAYSGGVGYALIVAVRTGKQVRRLVRERHGAVCFDCHYPLPEEEAGICPECGQKFTCRENRRLWHLDSEGREFP